MPANYTHQGKGHRILSFLEDRSATRKQIAAAVRGQNQTEEGADGRAFNMIVVLRKDGLIAQRGPLFSITDDGLAYLHHIGPYDWRAKPLWHEPVPNIRIFTKEPAHGDA